MRRLLLILLALSLPLYPYAQNRHKKTNAKTTVVSKRLTKHTKTPKKKVVHKRSKTKKYRTRKTVRVPKTSSIRNLQKQRTVIQKKIRQQEAALRANQNAVHQRLQDLMFINGEIDQSQQKIDDIQKDIKHINSNIGILEGQLRTLEQQLQERKAKYIKSMRYMSRHHSVQDKLMFIFSAKNFAQMYRRLQFIRQYSAYQKAQGKIVEAKQIEVNRKHQQLVKVKEHKNVLLYRGKIEQNNLQVKHGQQQQVVKSLQSQQKTIQVIIAQQHKKNAALNAQIDRLVAQEVARERAAAAAEARKKAAAVAAARKRAQILAQKRAAAAAAARANAQRIAQAKAREAQLKAQADAAARAASVARKKAAEEAEAARQAQANATKKAQAISAARAAEKARQAQAEAAARQTQADQAVRAAAAAREAAERKAQADAERNKKEIAVAKQQEQDAINFTAVDRMMNKGFEVNKGRLPMPITGNYRIVSHFGEYNVAGLKGVTLDNKGINILGGPRAMARSIYDGEVSYVFSYGGSMVVMVRHGAYISVYCNLKSVVVHKGQKVHTRQLLGTVNPDHILQFQLRKETAKLNPERWLER